MITTTASIGKYNINKDMNNSIGFAHKKDAADDNNLISSRKKYKASNNSHITGHDNNISCNGIYTTNTSDATVTTSAFTLSNHTSTLYNHNNSHNDPIDCYNRNKDINNFIGVAHNKHSRHLTIKTSPRKNHLGPQRTTTTPITTTTCLLYLQRTVTTPDAINTSHPTKATKASSATSIVPTTNTHDITTTTIPQATFTPA
ncbi:hypothetical protein CHS0354_017323 [Potamilus streckersoni]|uniref:Uncharacterized protein n=1 Tax=Potamilus streckersoni TaxID=2493646 RepID=A0AAE0T4D8_9BIVA|nr:hypothetical protein CHS0354_017323 [Potamilus streckersoni]